MNRLGLLLIGLWISVHCCPAKDKIVMSVRVSNPPETRQITLTTVEVTNVVEAEAMRYIIACRGHLWWGLEGSCMPMKGGDIFPAEIDGTTMWIRARKGGNQGKEVRIKNKILDIRPTEKPLH